MKKILAAFCILVAGCQTPITDQSITEEDRSAISNLEKTYLESILSKDETGLRTVLADDAITMPPNAPANVGIEAIINGVKESPALKEASTEYDEIEGIGELAYARGTFAVIVQVNDTTELPVNGKFMEVWKKQADGSWKLSRDIWNSNQAPD